MKTLESFINRRLFAFLILVIALAASAARAQTITQPTNVPPTDGTAIQPTSFTYQGRLNETGGTGGTYDFQFALFSQSLGGTAIGTTTKTGVSVVNGIFTVELDFGLAAFPDEERYLEIRVKRPAEANYTTLAPRQKITSAPFAIRAIRATLADAATNSSAVGGTPAANIIKEGDARLTDARTPSAGSLNYVQNTTTQQPNTDFNISGGGTLGGTLSANAVNSTTQFNIAGNRVLSIGGTENVFAGVNAGRVNTTGQNNAFFGENAGQANTTGSSNSFIGFNAGYSNTSGIENSFVGRNAGFSNSGGIRNSFFGLRAGFSNTVGGENSFFGRNAGSSNTTGSGNSFFGNGAGALNATGGNNTALGYNADFSANNLNYATAIGSGAIVSTSNTVVLGRTADTVQIPGGLNLTGTFTTSGTVSADVI
ncbi:MAG TPA: hypothetical protein VK308_10325, partial [Pyrinomonadaceae bacterium]|nr:hypothetical protein [Pyrinomonadaceae bacterium]